MQSIFIPVHPVRDVQTAEKRQDRILSLILFFFFCLDCGFPPACLKQCGLSRKPSPSYHLYWLPCELGAYSYQFLGFKPLGAGIKVLRRSVRFSFHSSLLSPERILLLYKCFPPLHAGSKHQTPECFDLRCPSPETNMRNEHRQRRRLMKQRRCCQEDVSCTALSLPHNQSVPGSVCPLDTHTPIWKDCSHGSLIPHNMCIICKEKQGLLKRLHLVPTDTHTHQYPNIYVLFF